MIAGHSSLGTVALKIIEDYGPVMSKDGTVHDRSANNVRYPLHQIIEKVCFRKESVSSGSNNKPSYVWWYIGLDEDNEISPIIDLGKFPRSVRGLGENKWSVRENWTKVVNEIYGPWKVAIDNEDIGYWIWQECSPLDIMLELGLSFGQRVLSRCVGAWSGYGEDFDMEWSSEIIYADACTTIDIPLSFPNFGAPSKFKSWRIA